MLDFKVTEVQFKTSKRFGENKKLGFFEAPKRRIAQAFATFAKVC